MYRAIWLLNQEEDSDNDEASIASNQGHVPDPNIDLTADEHLAIHKNNLINAINSNNEVWKSKIIQENNTEGREVFVTQTASKVSWKFLAPMVYRSVRDISDDSQLAAYLGISPELFSDYNAPDGLISLLLSNRSVQTRLTRLSGLDIETKEADVETCLCQLVITVISTIDCNVELATNKLRFVTGGILADEKFAVKGISDAYFRNFDDELSLVLEVKRMKTWKKRDLCYRSTRFTQAVSSLMFSRAPTLIITQEQWKLLILSSEEGHQILQYPATLSACGPIDNSLIRCIALCLLASDPERNPKTVLPMKDLGLIVATQVQSAEKAVSKATPASILPRSISLKVPGTRKPLFIFNEMLLGKVDSAFSRCVWSMEEEGSTKEMSDDDDDMSDEDDDMSDLEEDEYDGLL